jgi:hypothetical protein
MKLKSTHPHLNQQKPFQQSIGRVFAVLISAYKIIVLNHNFANIIGEFYGILDRQSFY